MAHISGASAQSFGGSGADVATGGGAGGGFGVAGSPGFDGNGFFFGGGGGGGGSGAAGGAGGDTGGVGGGTAGSNGSIFGMGGGNGGPGATATGTNGAGGGGGGGTGVLFSGNVAAGIGGFTFSGGSGGNGGDNAGVQGSHGGGGGSGGYGLAFIAGTASASTSAHISGGAGGAGGTSAAIQGSPNGGDGGAGVYFDTGGASFTLQASGTVNAGQGGASGTGGGAGLALQGGVGGAGGAGVLMLPGGSIENAGAIIGGNGGAGEITAGRGGLGIVGSGLTIDNTGGTITGGMSGGAGVAPCGSTAAGAAVVRACAVQFNGGANILGTGGTLSGGVNVAGGSFAPALANSIVGTTLNVGGPMIFASGTTFNIRITPTATDSVTATTADLGGANVNVTAGVGTYQNRQYTILTATGGFGTTRFGTVTSNFAFLRPTLSYDAGNQNAFLNIMPNDPTAAGTPNYTTAAANGNQFGIAQGLTYAGILTGANGNNPILTAFNQLTVPQAQAAFDSLTGEGITAAQNAAFLAGRLFTGSIADQILLFGGAPNSVIVPTGPGPLAYAPTQALATPIRVREPLPVSRPLYSWRAWGSGYGASQTISANPVIGNAQQRIGMGGGAVGVDYTWAPGMLTGLALGGSDGSFNVGARQTSGSTSGGHAAWYTLAEFGNIYAASTSSVSVFGNRTTRTVAGFGGLNGEVLRGNFTSTEFRTRVEFGYRFGITPGVTLTPFYAVEAAKLRSDGFTETALAGAGLFALNVRGQSASSVPMFFGARLNGAWDIGNGMWLRPSVQAAYVAEFAPVRNQIAGLVNLPGAIFLTDGARPARAAVQVKAGAELALLDNVALSANFDGEFSNRSNTYAGKGAIKVRW